MSLREKKRDKKIKIKNKIKINKVNRIKRLKNKLKILVLRHKSNKIPSIKIEGLNNQL